MKYTVAILACVLAAAYAQFNDGRYNPYINRYQTTPKPFKVYRPVPVTPTFATPVVPVTYPAPTYKPATVSRVVTDDRNAEILKYGNEVNPDGSYNYYYETSNGIAGQAQGTPRNFGGNPPVVPDVAQGSFSWTSPEGKTIVINYIADENGYQPSGDALPTPPALPAQIARALDYIARNSPQK